MSWILSNRLRPVPLWDDCGFTMRCCTGLLLLAALALSSASVQDVIKRKSARFRRAVDEQSFLFGGKSNLEWKEFNSSAPDGAVSIYNSYTGRTDYVCKYKCEAGFYNPNLGPYCHYPKNSREHKASDFQILVNKDNFEFLEWKEGTYGSVPQNSIRTCADEDVFVGKNKFGLGKVVPKSKSLYLPWEGDEYRYWYRSHQVLTMNTDTYTQEITDVKYAFDQAANIQNKPEVMQTMITTNNECQTTTKSVELNQERSTQTTWNVGVAVSLGAKTTITAGVPTVGDVGFEVSREITLDFHYAATTAESNTYRITMNLDVPPNHSCSVQMVGRRFKTNIPYTARLSRTNAIGQTQWTSITGTYSQVSMGEVRSVVGRCEPVPDARPCHSSTSPAPEHYTGSPLKSVDTDLSSYSSSSTCLLMYSDIYILSFYVSFFIF